ncbi:hypothetical protein [Psychroserpens ponticola]|uniref:WG repeat-containing protein n=1 Tax=Psychroserpens ponticola TaxID=2932268 RepID=A0ABY7RUB9_9FLAO|nr:hypothetical protein [Psychroserpens ponticola]WCO00362.1 hypothetical protein MUN68_009785 [Psychroserpens ponticola]
MKKQLLFIAAMLIGLTSATATTAGHAVSNREDYNTTRYRFAEPIVFIERGVEFLIFPDGSFDFNTEIENNTSNMYYRSNTKRSSVNTTYGAPGTINRVHYSNSRPRGIIITHDNNGQVRRIGNVFINYDREGRIKRAGSVYMSYQRSNGLLKQVGGLRINYNRWGEIVHVSGNVNRFNTDTNYGVGSGHGGNNYFGYNDVEDYDDDYYYYRKNGKIKKTKKNKEYKQS